MSYSRRELYALGEPFGDSCTRKEGGRTIYGGGGSGGGGNSGQVYYANQDKLLGTQADIAQNMYNTYANYAPSRLDAMNSMVNEAMDGRLADRARGQAAADAGTSLSNSLSAADRNLSRYGTTLNANSLSANLNDAALMGAANRSGAMNRANQWAESQKWARNSDMYSALEGMPGNATQSLGSAASGYGQMAGQQNQVNMANAMGYGQMGGMIGYGLMARDGGLIHKGRVVRLDDEPGYSLGGDVAKFEQQMQPGGFVGDVQNQMYDAGHPGGWMGDKMEEVTPGGFGGQIADAGMPGRSAWLANHSHANGGYIDEPHFALGGPAYSMPKLADWRSQATTQQNTNSSSGSSAVGQVASGAAPALAMYGLKNYVKPALKDAWNTGKAGYDKAQTVAEMQKDAGTEMDAVRAQREALEAKNGSAPGDAAPAADATPAADTTAANTTAADTTATTTADTAGTAAVDTGVDAGANLAGTAGADALETGGAMALDSGAAAATDAAATAALAETGAETGALMATEASTGPVGWVALAGTAAYLGGDAMGWWADGGPVPHQPTPNRGLRKNMIPGGKVQGPGTETSDSIPAWLSDGEFVLNAEAVQMIGKDKLQKLNERGLKKRNAKAKPKAVKKASGIKKPVKK